MKKIVQVDALIAFLITSNSNAASAWETFKSWFTLNPGPGYKELEVKRPFNVQYIKETSNGWERLPKKKLETTKPDYVIPTDPIKSQIQVPVEKIEPEKAYKVIRLGSHVYYKEEPNKPVLTEAIAERHVTKKISTYSWQQPFYRRAYISPNRMQPLLPGYKYYVTSKSGQGPTLSIIEKQRAFTPKAKTAYERLQQTGVAE